MLKVNDLCYYNNKSDSFLINAVKSGDNDAFSVLVDRYSGIIDYNLSSFALRVFRLNSWFDNADRDDLFQECCIIFFKAVKRYDFSFDVKFSTYANTCIKNYLISLYRKYMKNSRYALVPFDDKYIAGSLSQACGGIYDAYNGVSDAAGILDADAVSALTDFERKVLSLYLQDKSYKSMAKILGKNIKSIDNAVCRIKNKFRQLVSTVK
jgi:RNA polymerase sporulation-specific sigma factor